MTYTDFLKDKRPKVQSSGIKAGDVALSDVLKPHQRDICKWAIEGGQRAIFADFGLGKSIMQLQILIALGPIHRGRSLIICPLGVRQEFKRDALNFFGLDLKFIRRTEEVTTEDGIYITNYESVRDGKLDVSLFQAVTLDEASVLRGYGTKTFQTFLPLFHSVPYRFVATATPDPNRTKELIHYAGFLGVMDTGQALTRFFQRDSTQANNLTLYPHKVEEFWEWVHSWAVFITSPSDLGYADEGYALPNLNIHWHTVECEDQEQKLDSWGQGFLIAQSEDQLAELARHKRKTIPNRVAKMLEILGDCPDDSAILWHTLEDERHAIQKAVPKSLAVWGTQDLESREQRIIDFSDGAFKYLSTKPELCGSGCNFQRHCHTAIFVGIDYRFNDFIQSVHRIYRFLQTEDVEIHIIHTEAEMAVRDALKAKWAKHIETRERMREIIKEKGLVADLDKLVSRSMGCSRRIESSQNWTAVNNDCVIETENMDANSVDLIVTSIPFANHYEYTPSYNDFGHTDNNDHFWKQMDFLTPNLLKVLRPGRIYACHVKDRINFGNVTGAGIPTVSPFHAEALFHGIKHGFDYMGMITVVTDVVRENNQTYRLGWSEMCKDGSKMGVGSPEYILLFHKPQTDRTRGYADDPIKHTKDQYSRARWQVDAHAFWRSSGNRQLSVNELSAMGPDRLSKLFTKWSLQNVYDYDSHIEIGEALEARGSLPATFMSIAPGSNHPDVWQDVNRMITSNSLQAQKGKQLHVCLAEGSKVLTKENGYVPIECVNEGDEVLTHMGRWRRVLVSRSTGARETVNVKGQGFSITVTPDHKLWARSGKGKKSRNYATSHDPEWTEAQHVGSDYLNLKLAPVEPSDVDERTWWIVGRWLADGHIDGRGTAVISCGNHKIDALSERLGEFGGNPFRVTGNSCTQIALKDPDRKVRDIISRCGKLAHGKHLPAEAFTLEPKLAKALLDGYLSGDGHFVKSRSTWTASSVSRDLLLGMVSLVQRAYGAVATLCASKPPAVHTIEGRLVQSKQLWVMSFTLPDKAVNKTPFILDDGSWRKVRFIEPAGLKLTWCLRVEEDESFTAEGCVVKNCPLQWDIVDRLIERYSNPGDVVFDPFGGLGTVSLRAVKVGRRGMHVELNSGYWSDGVQYLKAQDLQMSTPSLFDFIDMIQDEVLS